MARSDLGPRVLVVMLGALGVPGLIACNALIGLDSFDKTDCPGAHCAFDVVVDADGAVDANEAASPTPGASPVSWAQWPMPNYGSDSDGGAQLVPRPTSYVQETDGTVLDTTTKLGWRVGTRGLAVGYAQALPECQKLGPEWRLPKRIELVTLLDHTRPASSPTIDSAAFHDVVRLAYWTSSEVRPFVPTAPQYWAVDFGAGAVMKLRADGDVAATICVKGKL